MLRFDGGGLSCVTDTELSVPRCLSVVGWMSVRMMKHKPTPPTYAIDHHHILAGIGGGVD